MKTLHLAIIVFACISIIVLVLLEMSNSQGTSQKTNLSFDHLACDMKCKTNNERIGRTCIEQSDNNFLCKSASRFVAPVDIPWDSKNMQHRRNFLSPNMTVSLEINNTVSWVNVDDFPHNITSDNGLFDSGTIQPNDTWTHVFDKVGTYRYHGDYPWLKGQINVVDFDLNYKGNTPIFKYTNTPTVFYYIFKETDSFWYVQALKVLDDNSVYITLSDYKNNTWIGEPITKTFKIGDSFIGNCGDNPPSTPQVEFLTLERIVTTPVPFAEFKDETGHISDTKCSFAKLEK
jgi:hypothetical protein